MTAACAGAWALFDAEDEASQARAAAVCEGCELKQQCLDGAGDDVWFVRGGLTPDERAELVRREGELFAVVETAVEVIHDRAAYVANAHGRECAACAKRNAEYVARWRETGAAVTGAGPFEQTAIDLGAAS